MRNTTITIDSQALTHNLALIKSKLASTTKVMAMVKADAYGHGIAHALPHLQDADAFGVACMSEALQVKACLQQLSIDRPVVLIEGVFSHDEWQLAIQQGFGCVIHHQQQLDWALANQPASDSFTQTIWLKHNTGMNRLGFDDEQIITAAQALNEAGYRLILTSHFACADDVSHPLNKQQIDRFGQALKRIRQFAPQTLASLCNSAGIFNFANEHHDWVRAGIALYGGTPLANHSASHLGLRPAMTLTAQLIATHDIKAEEAVGYGSIWQASQDQRIGVVSIGYGDGYPRVVKNAQVKLQDNHQHWHLRPIIGRVAMDMLMVDIDGLDIDVGNAVILWGDAPHIDDIASQAGTIGYELMCRLTQRPIRVVR